MNDQMSVGNVGLDTTCRNDTSRAIYLGEIVVNSLCIEKKEGQQGWVGGGEELDRAARLELVKTERECCRGQ